VPDADTDVDTAQFTPERLADRAQIASVMAAYTRCADLNLPDQQAETFTVDGRVSFHPDAWIEGRPALAAAMRASLARFQRTSHHLGSIEVTFDGADTAAAESTVIAWHCRLDGSEWTLYGRYYDRWVRSGSSWLIAERTLRAAGAIGRDASELSPLDRASS
jgi:SnoaL-like domain